MNKRRQALEHLETEGNFIENEETGRRVERVNMVGGKYLTFENGQVSGFRNFVECMKWVGIV